MEPFPRSVMVGVTGRGENTDALRFGLSEARLLGCGLTLVHAVPPMPPAPPSILMTDASWAELGRAIFSGSLEELEALDEFRDGTAVPVAAAARHGDPHHVFRDLSANATRIVLQHRDLSRLHRIITGSTVASVAAHAECPVASVPSLVGPAVGKAPQGTVTVGIDRQGGPQQVLEVALAEASARSSSLRLVHGWQLPSGYEDVLVEDARWTVDVEAHLLAATEDLRAKYADVEAELSVRHDWPADLLVRAGHDSDLVVVGRHSRLPILPARLGHLARAVTANASCPVMIVPV